MFNILSKIVGGTKGAIVSTLTGVTDVTGSLVNAVKNLTVNTLNETGDFLREGIQIPAAIVKGAVQGMSEIGVTFIKAIKGIISGTIQGAMDGGVSQKDAVKGAVSQALYNAKELGEDIAETAVEAVKGAISGVTKAGGDVGKATITAVKTALNVAGEFGEETVHQVGDSLSKSVEGVNDIIKEIEGKNKKPVSK